MLPEIDPRAALPPMTAYYLMKCGATALVPYYRPGDPAVADAIKGLAGKYASVLLANHGPAVAGAVAEAPELAGQGPGENARPALAGAGHQHQSGRVRNRKRQLRRRDHRLRGHAAGPEHRNFIGLHRHRIAIVRFGEIGDADRLRMAEMDRRAMHGGKARGDLHRADGVG